MAADTAFYLCDDSLLLIKIYSFIMDFLVVYEPSPLKYFSDLSQLNLSHLFCSNLSTIMDKFNSTICKFSTKTDFLSHMESVTSVFKSPDCLKSKTIDHDRKCIFFTCGDLKILSKSKNNPIIMSTIVDTRGVICMPFRLLVIIH